MKKSTSNDLFLNFLIVHFYLKCNDWIGGFVVLFFTFHQRWYCGRTSHSSMLSHIPKLHCCLLTPFVLQFKESVAQFAQENIAPHASAIDRSNHFPKVNHVLGF